MLITAAIVIIAIGSFFTVAYFMAAKFDKEWDGEE